MKIAAVADIHVRATDTLAVSQVIKYASDTADVLLLPGDLTQEGTVEEAQVLRKLLLDVPIPVIAVLGNHDYESGQENEIIKELKSPTFHLLNGDFTVINGIGFVGVKGFMGGFTNRMTPKFGERLMKDLVDYGTNEALMLERALAQLDTKIKIALMHYAPVRSTVVGEPEEVYPFLGLTRLEEPLDRYGVSMVFHGHAHHGTYEGKTTTGIPVYNVSLPVLTRLGMQVSIHKVT